MDILTEKDRDFCEMAGLFGCLITLTCLVQQFIFMEPHWISYSIGLTYLVSLTGFFLLTRKSSWAFPLLLAGSIMTFMMETLTIILMTFSLVLLILLVYLTVSTTLLTMDGIHKRIIKQRKQNLKEAQEWEQAVG